MTGIADIMKQLLSTLFAGAALAAGAADATGLAAYYDFDTLPAAFAADHADSVDGLRGSALKIGDDGDRLSYLRLPNDDLFTGAENTVSFWISPLDWDGGKDGFIFLIGVATPDNSGFRIYKYTGGGGFLWFLSGNRQGDATAMQEVFARINDWQAGEWHHIAISYRPGGKTFIGKESRQRIYLDGKLAGEKSIPEEMQPTVFPDTWTVGPAERWGAPTVAHSAVDELKIFNRELSPEEIRAEYLRLYTPKTGQPGRATAGFLDAAAPPFDAEFDRVAGGANLFDDSRGHLQQTMRDPGVEVAATAGELLLRIRENVADLALKTAAATRDGATYLDDSYEILVALPDLAYRQYVINSAGIVYDGIKMDGGWNGSAAVSSRIEAGIWTLEVRIPAADLELAGFEPGQKIFLGVGRNYLATGQRLTFGNCDFRGFFHQPEILQTVTLLPAGEVAARVAIDASSPETLRIAANTPVAWQYGVNGAPAAAPPPAKDWSLQLERAQTASRYDGRLISADGQFDAALSFVVEPRLLVTSELEPDSGFVRLLLQPTGAEDAALFAHGTVTILADGEAVAERPYAAELLFAPGELPERSFALEARIAGTGGEPIASGFLDYYFIDYAAWRDYDGGTDDDDVPTPWVPVDYRDDALYCLNREYRLDGGFLPAQTFEQGEAILAAPMTLEAVIDGQRCDFAKTPLREVSRKAGKVELAGDAEIGGCRIAVTAVFEFDGYYLVDCRLDRQGRRLDSLRLSIPFNAANSQLKFVPFLNEKPVESDDAGAVLPEQSWDFGPGIWVGGDHRGVTWFTESDEFHFRRGAAPMYRLVKTADTATLNIDFIDAPGAALPETLRYQFGLQVTPVKPFPEPEDWMAYSFVRAPNNKIYISGWGNLLGSNYQGLPGNDGNPNASAYAEAEARHIAALVTGALDGNADYGIPLLAIRYLYPNMAAVTVPEFQAFRRYWETLPGDVWGTDGPDNVPAIRVSPQSDSWSNFYCWRFDRYFAESRENGVYQDFAHPILDLNPLHGAGYERDGKRYPTYCIFRHREINKRLYRIAKKYETPERPVFFIGHSGGTYMLPYGNFWQMTNDGEYFGAVVNERKPYCDFFTPERLRAEFNGRQFGIMFNFIPIAGMDEAYTADMFALIVPAGVTWMHHSMINQAVQWRVWNAFAEFGYEEITGFHPFWDHAAMFASAPETALVSVFEKPEKLLLAAGNPSDTRQQVSVQFQRPITGYRFEGESEWRPATDQTIRFEVEPRNFRYVHIRR